MNEMRAPVVFMAALALALAALSTIAPAPVVAQQDRAPRGFTAAEKARLGRGELVRRMVSKRRGSLTLVGGSAWQVIDAPPDAVFRALSDVPRYPRMLPRVSRARVVSSRGNQKVLMIQHDYGVADPRYYLRTRFYPERRDITFTLDDSRQNSLRAAWGFFTVRPYGRNRTLLAYGCMADVGDGVVSGFLRSTVHDWMMRVPNTIMRFVEGSGRRRYVSASGRSGG
jgi:hypothetical protein